MLDRIEAEHPNLRSALQWSLAHSEPLLALRLGASLGPYWGARGHFSEGRRWLAAALSAAPDAPALARARAFGTAGDLAWKQGDFQVADSLHEDALALYRSLGDAAGIAETLNDLGNLALGRQDYETARRLHRESLQVMSAAGNRWGEARSLMGCGNVDFQQGDEDGAQHHWTASLATFRALGDERAIANVVVNLGALAARRGKTNEARLLYAEGLASARAFGLVQLLASTAYNLGDLAVQACDWASASGHYKEALRAAFESGEKVTIAYGLEGMAMVAARTDRPETAVCLFAAADSLRIAIDSPLPPAELDTQRCELAALRGSIPRADLEAQQTRGQVQPLERTVAEALAIDIASAIVPAARPADRAGLTSRELDVVRLVAQGLSDARVARQLKISPATVSKHVGNALGKTMLRNRVELTLWALERGFAAPADQKPPR